MAKAAGWFCLALMALTWGRIGLDFLFYFLGFREAGLSKPVGILLWALGLAARLGYEVARGLERERQTQQLDEEAAPTAWQVAYLDALRSKNEF